MLDVALELLTALRLTKVPVESMGLDVGLEPKHSTFETTSSMTREVLSTATRRACSCCWLFGCLGIRAGQHLACLQVDASSD